MNAIDLKSDLQESIDRAAKGIRQEEEAFRAAAEVDQIREKNRSLFGDAPIGVEILREFRGPLPE